MIKNSYIHNKLNTTTVKDIQITYGRILARFLDSKSHRLDNIGAAGQLAHNQLCIGNWFCTRTSGIFGQHLHWLFPLAHYTESLKKYTYFRCIYHMHIYFEYDYKYQFESKIIFIWIDFLSSSLKDIGFWFLKRNN